LSDDKRQYQRYTVRVPLFIAADDELFHKKVHLESRDVSAGGLSFETGKELPLSAESRVVLARLGDIEEPAVIEGRVARVTRDEATGRYVIGIEFTQFVNVTREQLLERLESSWQPAE
jgi:c-di-GMP-binding flagellar brake protein YcgR